MQEPPGRRREPAPRRRDEAILYHVIVQCAYIYIYIYIYIHIHIYIYIDTYIYIYIFVLVVSCCVRLYHVIASYSIAYYNTTIITNNSSTILSTQHNDYIVLLHRTKPGAPKDPAPAAGLGAHTNMIVIIMIIIIIIMIIVMIMMYRYTHIHNTHHDSTHSTRYIPVRSTRPPGEPLVFTNSYQ